MAISIALLLLSSLPDHGRILDAICWVETRGGTLVSDGDAGSSIGPFQIQYSYWRDAAEFDSSLGGNYSDCRQRPYADRVVRAYMLRHVPDAWRRLDAEVIARTHNGGPRGAEKSSTRPYWAKVTRALHNGRLNDFTSLERACLGAAGREIPQFGRE